MDPGLFIFQFRFALTFSDRVPECAFSLPYTFPIRDVFRGATVLSPHVARFGFDTVSDNRNLLSYRPVEPSLLLLSRLDIFAPHQQQCGLGIDIHQLRESLHRNPSERSHPVLLNAIYLWACFVSRPEPLCQNEDHYLRLVLETLPDALKSTDKLVDAIQASCLLSMYYLANGRMCEGGYHASAAAALAVQAGLGRNAFQNDLWPPACSFEDFDLKPAKTAPQDDARIMSFWQIFSLDRCWSVFLQRPSIIPDGPDARNVISCPWPQDLGSYETVRDFSFLIVTMY